MDAPNISIATNYNMDPFIMNLRVPNKYTNLSALCIVMITSGEAGSSSSLYFKACQDIMAYNTSPNGATMDTLHTSVLKLIVHLIRNARMEDAERLLKQFPKKIYPEP